MARPSFSSVEINYSTAIISPNENTCAIRLSMVLMKADIVLNNIFKMSTTNG